MQESTTIQKIPDLPESSNYELLRQNGLQYIQQLGSRFWTDYNIHDPGITILELLCYAITDLGYRTSYDIKDLLAVPFNQVPDHNRQAFYTAREILTVNPWTNADFRKLLIDIDGVKNAWLVCKKCACNDLYLYADCRESVLLYDVPPGAHAHKVTIRGLYDVLIEFEDEEGSGNLNSGKIKYNFSFLNNFSFTSASIELRLPSWQEVDSQAIVHDHFNDDMVTYEKFLQLVNAESTINDISSIIISGTKDDNLDIPASELSSRLRRPVYATFTVAYTPGADLTFPLLPAQITFIDVPLTVWFKSDSDRKAMQMSDLKTGLADASGSGIVAKYIDKMRRADQIIELATQVLHDHRNLAEDYCSIKAIETEDIGVCADLEVDPSVDIEAVLAEIYFLIDQYFSPDIKFYSLKELLDEGRTVDEIFDGPRLNNGFIDTGQLETTNLKKTLYASDIINLVMDVPGVKAIKNFVLTRYNHEGFLVESQPWSMEVTNGHQPRLYVEGSKILVFKNGLPFLADKLELMDTLQVVIGSNAQPKFSIIENDLPVPVGTWFDFRDYFPLQYSLPLTYGVGYEGLPSTASPERKAQAKQLKAYLLFYEQLLIDYLEQIAHIGDLFAVDATVGHSYFTRLLTNAEVRGIDEIINGLTIEKLQAMQESPDIFFDRRNRFLNHMLARFAEHFNEYALMLYSYERQTALTQEKLIKDKIEFLKDYPFMSYNRARSFNYKDPGKVCHSENIAGLTMRIRRLLGIPEFSRWVEWVEEKDTSGKFLHRYWQLTNELFLHDDEAPEIFLVSNTQYTDLQLAQSEQKAQEVILEVRNSIADPVRYQVTLVTAWELSLVNEASVVLAVAPQTFSTQLEAEDARDRIIEFATKIFSSEKVFIVEHLLLRPANKPGVLIPAGDALLPVCIGPDCNLCGEEDPYSFRLTIVLNGEEGIANSGVLFRRFAERTIRKEVPAHLALKICWVSNRQLSLFEKIFCDWLKEKSKQEPDELILSNKLHRLICMFGHLKNVYPAASLHDCVDGNDENRLYLNQSII
jgi:hypothetical protein